MDGSVNGKGTLRIVIQNYKKNNKSTPVLNPRDERRRKLYLKRRTEEIILFWRILFYAILSGCLGLLFIKSGWKKINISSIEVKGSNRITSEDVFIAAKSNLSTSIIYLNHTKVQESLIKNLPIKSASISRRILPSRVEIQLQEMKPVAKAERARINTKEIGMIDIDGYWIPLTMKDQTAPPSSKVLVEGWSNSQRLLISSILKRMDELGSPLEKIILTPNGELILRTSDFEFIQFGDNPSKLDEQLKVLRDLTLSLPDDLIKQKGITIDIRDPSKPELQMSQASK